MSLPVFEVQRMLNLTPHEVTVNGIIIPASGVVARVGMEVIPSHIIKYEGESFSVGKMAYGEILDLPPFMPGQVCIVSGRVLDALHENRIDVIGPDTSPNSVIRDSDGKIVGVKQFIY